MKVIGIVGSLRKGSYNLMVANKAKEELKDFFELDIVTLNDLPMFNEDLEDNLPKEVVEFKQNVDKADAVIIFSPEYNHSIPGVLKNALDWLSREGRQLAGKPVLVVNASISYVGGARSNKEITSILNAPGVAAIVMPSTFVLIPEFEEKLDSEGNYIDPKTVEYLKKCAKKFIKWAEAIKEYN